MAAITATATAGTRGATRCRPNRIARQSRPTASAAGLVWSSAASQARSSPSSPSASVE